jgi:ATP-dependent DNA helicase RecG
MTAMVGEGALKRLVRELAFLPRETPWVERKLNNSNSETIGQAISALSNSAALHGHTTAHLVWGLSDNPGPVAGTDFRFSAAKVGNQELENWIATQLEPHVDFRVFEFSEDGKPVVLINIPCATHAPVAFRGRRFIRVGQNTQPLEKFVDIERSLWRTLSQGAFESEVAKADVTPQGALSHLDYQAYFGLTKIPVPRRRGSILRTLVSDGLLVECPGKRYDITNLGAILFARRLADFDSLHAKALRVTIYAGNNRTESRRGHIGARGYAVGFRGAIGYIMKALPVRETTRRGLRVAVPEYPEAAIRELLANALIHQDFRSHGMWPTVEVFSDRVEITNPGHPLKEPIRFMGSPPKSRNPNLGQLLYRAGICEQRGSGIEKVIRAVEESGTPAPEFEVSDGAPEHTKVILWGPKELPTMTREERLWTCFWHICLKYVSKEMANNGSLRQRLSTKSPATPYTVSRILAEACEAKYIKPKDPRNTSRKLVAYVPIWA